MIPLIDEEIESYEKQKVCYICKKEFNADEFDTYENDKNALKLFDKVKDHCLYTGKLRGAAHNICKTFL